MSEDRQAELRGWMDQLGLMDDDWGMLLALPLVEGADLRPDWGQVAGDALSAFSWPQGRCTERMVGWVEWWRRLPGDDTRRSAAWRLLCWRLARELPFQRREEYFQALRRVAGQAARSYWHDRLELAAFRVRELVDEFLPHSAFTLFPTPPAFTRADEGLGLLPPEAWVAFLPACVLRLRNWDASSYPTLDNVTSRLSHSMEVKLEGKELIHPLWRFLARAGTYRDPAWQTRAEALVLSELSFLPYAQREKVLVALEKALSLAPTGTPLTNIVREKIDRARRNVAEKAPRNKPAPPPPPAALPVAAPVIPVAPTSPFEPVRPIDRPVEIIYPERRQAPRAVPPAPTVNVADATGFAPVPIDAALRSAREMAVAEVEALLDGPLLFDAQREECPAVAIVRKEEDVPSPLWIVGDLHADLLALANIWAFIEADAASRNEKPAVVFLGDFIDRGEDDHHALLLLFKLIRDNPGRVAVLAGNHDLELVFDEATGRFRSNIEPAEYAARLNGLIEAGEAGGDEVRLGRLFSRFMRSRPRAAFLPDGTLLTHGGFPHTDLHEGLRSAADLGKGRCPQDFTWLRINDTSERKRPNPGNKGCQFGWGDLARFSEACKRIGVPVARLVRGHDHVLERYQAHEEYRACQALTINAMGWRGGDEKRMTGEPARPCVARHAPGRLPDLFRVGLAAARPVEAS